jgi:hypothetical protein
MLTIIDNKMDIEKITYLNTVTYDFFQPGTQFAKILSAMQIQNALLEEKKNNKEIGGFNV